MNLTKRRPSFGFFAILVFFSVCTQSEAEPYATCQVNFGGCFFGPREICSINVYPGEAIVTKVTFKDYVRYGYTGYGEFYYSGARSGSMRLYSGQTGELNKFGTNTGVVKVGFNDQIPRLCDFLSSAKVYTDRTNLKVESPEIDLTTGDYYLPHRVTTNTKFTPGSIWVSLKLWADNNSSSGRVFLGEWGLRNCVNKANCYDRINIPFTNRQPIPRNLKYLRLGINTSNSYVETTRNDNYYSQYLGEFLEEKIPDIMGNYSSTWWLAKEYLNRWIDNPVKIKNPNFDNGIDWSLSTFRSLGTGWFLESGNTNNNRIKDKFKELIKPSYFYTSTTKEIIANRVRQRFAANPTATSIKLSTDYWSGYQSDQLVKGYHSQQVTYIRAQDGGIFGMLNPIDAVTGAFGGFSFYLVPFGSAVKQGTQYKITINEIAIHVIDSFDFNGTQPLGCFTSPNVVSPGWCYSNSSFRRYRYVKARGWDHNIFTQPYHISITPLIFYVNR